MVLFFLFFSTLSFAGTSRAPAILNTSCDLDIPVKDITLVQVHKEQCKRIQQCMGSAPDEEMPGLKKLEALVCKGELVSVTTPVPKLEVNKAELNGNSRREKNLNQEISPIAPTSPVIEK